MSKARGEGRFISPKTFCFGCWLPPFKGNGLGMYVYYDTNITIATIIIFKIVKVKKNISYYIPVVGEVKNTPTVFPAFRKRRIKGTERGDLESPPLYFSPAGCPRQGGEGRFISPKTLCFGCRLPPIKGNGLGMYMKNSSPTCKAVSYTHLTLPTKA